MASARAHSSTQLLARMHSAPADAQTQILHRDEPDAYLSSQGQQDLLRIGAAARPEGGEPLADHAIPVERLGRQASRSTRDEEVGQAIGEGERRT